MSKNIEIMDTTLRDGEQSPGMSFSPEQKLAVVEALLTRACVNRVEVASAGTNPQDAHMLQQVTAWAREHDLLNAIEVLGFADGERSVDWIFNNGGRVMNLLCKGSFRHCQQVRGQEYHWQMIEKTIVYAVTKGLTVNVYLEDWSQGMGESGEYISGLTQLLGRLSVRRVMLCDTLGVLDPVTTAQYIQRMHDMTPDRAFVFDFHGHNDYGMATANALAAVQTGHISGVHVTVNGLGERNGNSCLAEVVVALRDHANVDVTVQELELLKLSGLVSTISGRRVPQNAPIVGRDSRTNTAGVHADGDGKGNLYYHPKLRPGRFGDPGAARYSLGKLSGKSNVRAVAAQLGIELNDTEIAQILARIVQFAEELGKIVTEADLPFIVADILERREHVVFELIDVQIHSPMRAPALVGADIRYRGKEYKVSGHGDGGLDAFMCALRQWAASEGILIVLPDVRTFETIIPETGGTAALVQAVVLWSFAENREIQTTGLHANQAIAAIMAAERAINHGNMNGH